MKCKHIFIILIIILLPSIYANTEYNDYGFGVRSLTLSNTRNLWHSPLNPIGNINVSISIPISSTQLPTIDDFNGDLYPEIIMWGASNIYLLNNLGNLLDSYPVSGGVMGRGSSYRSDIQGKNNIALLENASGNYSVTLLSVNAASFSIAANYPLPSRNYSGYIFAGDASDYIAIPDTAFNTIFMNRSTGEYYLMQDPHNMTRKVASNLLSTSILNAVTNNWIFADLNYDGSDEFVYAGNCNNNTGSIGFYGCFHVWDSSRRIYIVNDAKFGVGASAAVNSISIQAASVGLSTAKTIFIDGQAGFIGIQAWTLSGIQLLSASGTNTILNSNIIVGDINADSMNEVCKGLANSTATSRLYCWDSNLHQKYSIKGAFRNNGYITGSNRYFYQDDGLYINYNFSFNNITNAHDIEADVPYFPITSYATIPINLERAIDGSSGTFFNDLFLWNPASSAIILTSAGSATCGNDICDTGETSVNCFIDCASELPAQAVITIATIEPCYQQTWKENTSVKITIKAENDGKSKVSVRAILYNGSANAQDSGYSPYLPSASIVTYSFKANLSITKGIISIFARSEAVADPDTLDLNFDVSPSNGFSLGDSSCSIIQPLTVPSEADAINGKGTDNGIYKGLLSLSALTGLSGTILWLIIIFLITIVIILSCNYSHVPPTIMIAAVFLSDIILIVIGAFLKVIPVSFIIIISLALIVAVGLWFRGVITGSSGQ